MFVCTECGTSEPQPGYCAADGAVLAPAADDPLLGTTIGVYRIARLMGIGGMGRVYKGVHPTIGSRVAIKVLSRESSDRRDLVERFFAEAKAVNLIRHESIVDVLDLSRLPDGRPYLVMEYLDGCSLSAIIEGAKRGGMPLPIGGVARLCVEVLDALAAAHTKGIIHRDLKPDNIYVTRSGRPKVLDFGIAKLLPEHGGSSTHTGSLLGTPHYMSPEQATGQSLDPRADLYAIGVILFECVALRRPFVADVLFDLLRMHIEAPPPSPRTLRPDLPDGVESVILTALAKDPAQRFGSAHAMSMALQNATAGLPPQQWTAVLPPGSTPRAAASAGPAGWAPTPPSSWAAGNQSVVAPSLALEATRASHAPQPPGPSAPVGAAQPQQASSQPVSTQTAGQVAHMPPAKAGGSRKGLWIGLGAVVLVGAGVTAAVLENANDSQSSASTQQESGSSGNVAQPASAPSSANDPWSGDPWGHAAVPGNVAAGSATDSVVPAPVEDDARAIPSGDDNPLDTLGQLIERVGPDGRKVLAPEIAAALDKYGSWSNVPPAEKLKLSNLVSRADLTAQLKTITDSQQAVQQSLRATPSPATAKPNGFDQGAMLELPWKLDVKNVDTRRVQRWAMAEAKKLASDIELLRIDTAGILADGRADFTVDGPSFITYKFISPSRVRRAGAACTFSLHIDKQAAQLIADSGACSQKPVATPRCNFAGVWKKAIAKGAPKNAVGQLIYLSLANDGKAVWGFTIQDPKAGINFHQWIEDDCGAAL